MRELYFTEPFHTTKFFANFTIKCDFVELQNLSKITCLPPVATNYIHIY